MADLERLLRDALPFWDRISEAQRRDLLNATVMRSYAKGALIHAGSEDCSGLILVESGQLRAFIVSETGKEITLYRLLPRDICIFSASCLFKNITFELYVEAEQDTRACLIPTTAYDRLHQNSLAIADYTSQLMASRFSDVMWLMEQVLFMSFDQRLSRFLLDQANMDGTDSLSITHETIARHMGSAREVVTRMLRYFQDEGLVELSRGRITLLDRAKLEALA